MPYNQHPKATEPKLPGTRLETSSLKTNFSLTNAGQVLSVHIDGFGLSLSEGFRHFKESYKKSGNNRSNSMIQSGEAEGGRDSPQTGNASLEGESEQMPVDLLSHQEVYRSNQVWGEAFCDPFRHTIGV